MLKKQNIGKKEIRTQLQQRAYMCEFYGPRGYVADLSFFIDGKWIPADLEKAEELAWLLYRTGTIGAEDILKTVTEKKYPDKKEDLNLQAILAIDPLRCAAKRDRSREVYPEFCAEMKNEGVSGQKAKIKWLLKKAGMDVAVEEVQFPGAAAELEKQFLEARKLEAEGKDFKQVAQAYEPIAEAGHSEAMRRLGLIKRDILSENACTALYETGQKLLEKAAEAGNTLAAYDLGKKEPDIAFLAGLAGQENLDALYALGCLLENKNWEVAQACFRNIEEILGDPIAKKNGEGIEWLRKLGDKFGIMDSKYYLKLADAGTQIGYIPSQMELALMTHVMMERAFEKSGNKAGQYGDFGYAAYIINVLDGPAKAGIAKAKAMISNYRTEQSAYYTWQGKELKEAEAGTGIAWEYLKNKTTPKERLARTAANHHLQVQAVYYTRIFKGLNYYQIHKRLFDSDAGEASVEEFMKAMPATTSKNTASKSSFTYDSNAMDDYKADTSFKNMPSCIYDDTDEISIGIKLKLPS